MMLSGEEAKAIGAKWRVQFHDEVAFVDSWKRYFEKVGQPTADRLEKWLEDDQARDELRHMGAPREPILPVQSSVNDLGDCYHCGGKWYYRKDVPVGHPDFGKAFKCPHCNR